MRYLEIGTQRPEQNFDKVICEYKVSVDPDPNAHATFCLTSDDFFNLISKYDYLNQAQIINETKMYEISILDRGRAPNIDYIQPIPIPTTYDLIFIDGLHTAEQVKKDFENALKVLSPKGFIVLHDCNPLKEEHTIVPRPTERGHWNGDVYKFAVTISNKRKVTVDIDNGCAVIDINGTLMYVTDPNTKNITWDYFDKNRKKLLNLISWNEFIALSSLI